VNPYAILAAQARQVMLDAIGKSDGSRSSVIDEVYKTKVNNGLIGSFSFNENGDSRAPRGVASLHDLQGQQQPRDVRDDGAEPEPRTRRPDRRRPASHSARVGGGLNAPPASLRIPRIAAAAPHRVAAAPIGVSQPKAACVSVVLGVVFVVLLVAWLIVNAIKTPTDFFNVC
jgi:hypothetical protein